MESAAVIYRTTKDAVVQPRDRRRGQLVRDMRSLKQA
jgi:hypothetical protein